MERRYGMAPLAESSIPGCKRQGRRDFRPWVYFRCVRNSEEGLSGCRSECQSDSKEGGQKREGIR